MLYMYRFDVLSMYRLGVLYMYRFDVLYMYRFDALYVYRFDVLYMYRFDYVSELNDDVEKLRESIQQIKDNIKRIKLEDMSVQSGCEKTIAEIKVRATTAIFLYFVLLFPVRGHGGFSSALERTEAGIWCPSCHHHWLFWNPQLTVNVVGLFSKLRWPSSQANTENRGGKPGSKIPCPPGNFTAELWIVT